MSFLSKVAQARDALQENGRVSLRALCRELDIENDELDDIVEELVHTRQLAKLEGHILIWAGDPATPVYSPIETTSARKVVSILFADLVGSTGLHERLDPESTRRFMENYYDVARRAVESHGGRVTQFLGDGVKAVFGVPRVAEDDAIRAVHAAVAMQEGFKKLAEQQAVAVGSTGLRVAVNTGEVIAEGETEIIGDPVNVAARLQEHGNDGEVVIGESTEHLVGNQITLELLGAFDLKGRSGNVKAYKVLSLEPPQRTVAAFVGREKELARITAVYDQAVETPGTRMAVLLGSAGLGKSRLIGEFARRSNTVFSTNATVIQAHCDAAKGATFSPLAEAFRKHLELEAGASTEVIQEVVSAVLASDEDQKRITTGIVGLLTGQPASPEETFFVVRRFLAAITTEQPVVLIIDDLQWAEPLLFDLVEHLVQWGPNLPLFILIGARPELREVRSSFGKTGGFVTDVLMLEGLDASSSMKLAAGVIGAGDLPAAVAAKVLATTEGNPLFIGELIRMLVVEGALIHEDGEWRVGETLATVEMPPTIHALLASRIERLDPLDCAILERAAVIGRHFSRNAVTALLPNDPDEIDARLEALQRFELIERGTGWFIGDPVLRFHHVLIRDAAYRRLLKGSRAELHAKLADWIEAQVGDAYEHDELIGRHLEDAHRLLEELGPLDAAGEELGERAAARLSAAGRRALDADDVPLAASLLGRALERMRPDHAERADLCIDWCEALLAEGEVSTAAKGIEELSLLKEGSERLTAWQQCLKGHHTVLTAPRELTATVASVAKAADTLAGLEDSAGEAKAHFVHAIALSRQGQIGACEAALDQALAAARKANDRRQANTVLAIAPVAALWGPSPVTRASGRCLDVVRVLRITQGAPAVEAVALMCQGVLEALRGRSEAAHRMIESGREMVEELGIAPQLRNADAFAGYVHLLENNLPEAEEKLRRAYEGLRDLGLGIDAARAAAMLAQVLLTKGKIEEAKTLSHESEELAGDDLKAAIAWRGVRAEALARGGEHDDAIKLAQKAVRIAEKTDALLDHADARQALAVALRAAGQSQEADTEEQKARKLWEDKGAILLLDAREDTASKPAATEVPQNRTKDPSPELTISPGVQYENQFLAISQNAVDAITRGDFDKFRSYFHDDCRELDHTTGATYGADGVVTSIRNLFKSENPFHKQKILAALGSNLILLKRHWGASGSASKRMDVGAFESSDYLVTQANDDGLWIYSEVFAENKLGDAIQRLFELYVESLPEGPERDKAANIAHFAKITHGPIDADRFVAHFADDIVLHDYRTVGVGEISGKEAASQPTFVLVNELTENLHVRVVDIYAWNLDGMLICNIGSGIEKKSGGEFERVIWQLCTFNDKGQVQRWEQFDLEHKEQAIARFHELTGGESVEPERIYIKLRPGVQPNQLTNFMGQFVEALKRRDFSWHRQQFSESYIEIDHPTGSTIDKEGTIASLERLFRSEEPYYHIDILATLGPWLQLGIHEFGAASASSKNFDVGAYENVRVQIDFGSEENSGGTEVFGANQLGDAIACLYERYAESLPEGPKQTKAQGLANIIRAGTGPIDPERLKLFWSDNVQLVDHRTAGMGTVEGADAVTEAISVMVVELTEDFTGQFDDVVSLKPDALLCHYTTGGKGQMSGGDFEQLAWYIMIADEQGKIARWEIFEEEQLEQALARFEELTSASQHETLNAPDTSQPRRRVTRNAALEVVNRVVEATNAQDWPALRACFSDDYQEHHYPTGSTFGADDHVASFQRLYRSQDPFYEEELVASLGDSLGLIWMKAGASGAEGKRYSVGAYEQQFYVLQGINDQQQYQEGEVFAENKLGDALARLYERYAEALPDGPDKKRAVTAAALMRFYPTMDLKALAELASPNIEYFDHRNVGTGKLVGMESVVSAIRVMTEDLTENLRGNVHDVLCLQPDAFLIQYGDTGTDKRSGGAFERRIWDICLLGEDGLISHYERFDEDKAERALARFDELTGDSSSSPGQPTTFDDTATSPFSNTATRTISAATNAYRTRHWEKCAEYFTEDVTLSDRRALLRTEIEGRDQWLEYARQMGDMPFTKVNDRILATRGEGLVLRRIDFEGSGGDVGPSEISLLELSEVNEAGKCVSMVRFDVDDIDIAFDELDARFSAGEAANRISPQLAFRKAIEARNWDCIVSLAAPEFVEDDHRPLAVLGTRVGPENWAETSRVLVELAPDTQVRIDHIRLGSGCSLNHATFHGTQDGGRFEMPFITVAQYSSDGLLIHHDLYEPEQIDEAAARFDGICANNAGTTTYINANPGNTAFNTMKRLLDAYHQNMAVENMEPLRKLCHTDMLFNDARHMAQIEGDVDLMLAGLTERAKSGAKIERVEVVKSAGSNFIFANILWGGGPPESRFEIEYLLMSETDEAGRIKQLIFYDLDDEEKALTHFEEIQETLETP